MMSYPARPVMTLDHERCNESKNCAELRESGVDHGVGLDVVALADAYDTVGADLCQLPSPVAAYAATDPLYERHYLVIKTVSYFFVCLIKFLYI